MKIVYLLVLISLGGFCSAQEDCPVDTCPSDDDAAILLASSTVVNQHYYIGGMFAVHRAGPTPYSCGDFSITDFVNMEAFFWAIKKYQQVSGKPLAIGGFVMDSCGRSERTLENVYSFETCRTYYTNISPRNTVAFVGPASSSMALPAAKLLTDLKRTQVLSSATSPELSHDDYSYLLRTIPSDSVETMVMAQLLKDGGIKYVQVLYDNTAYGIGLKNAFMENIKKLDICATQSAVIQSNNVVNFLKSSMQTRIVVVLSGGTGSRSVLEQANSDSNIKNSFVFMGTSAWGRQLSVIQGLAAEKSITITLRTDGTGMDNDVAEFWQEFYKLKPGSQTQITARKNPWFDQFWEQMFGCRLDTSSCNVTNQNLRDKIENVDNFVPFTLMAVKAIITGTQKAAEEYCKTQYLCSDLLNIDRGLKLNNYTRNITDSSGNRYFQASGDADHRFENYQIHRIDNGQYSNVMTYRNENGQLRGSTSFSFQVTSACKDSPCTQCGETSTSTVAPVTTRATTMSPIVCDNLKSNGYYNVCSVQTMDYYRDTILAMYFKLDQEITGVYGQAQERLDKDSQSRFEIGQEWIIALGVCAGLGIICVIILEIYILYKLMGTKIGKQWRTMWLGQLLMLGIFLCYLCCFAYLPTPTKATCGITRFCVGLCYTICFAVLLVKLMVLLTSKTSADTLLPGDVDSPNYLRGIYQFLMFMFIVGVQVVIGIMWLIIIPPEAVQVVSNNNDKVWICNHYTWNLDNGWGNMTMFVRTNFENHLISLSYVMFLILLTVIVAMKSHGIITNHRESVFIGIAAGFSVPVWIAWGLVGGLNKETKYAHEFGDGAIAFGLLITATIILFAMFLPKVRQLVNMGVEGIYLEDDRDTYYGGSVIMAPPSYKSRPSSVVYVNGSNYDPVVIGEPNAVHLRHPGSNYSAPVYVKRPASTIGHGSGKVLRMTGDLTGKHPRDSRKSTSDYNYAGSGYGGTSRKALSESGGTMRRAHSTQDLGAL